MAHPDMMQVFIVEADASNMAIVAVLSQRHGPKQTLHSNAYYSRKLIPAEQKYEILDEALLIGKTTFKEW